MKIIKKIRKFDIGFLKIKPRWNNIFITLTDVSGKVLLAKHAGILKFKGTKKRTPYIASLVLKDIISKLRNLNFYFKGFVIQLTGALRNRSFKNIIEQLFELKLKNIFYLQYIIKRTHNGLRKKKKRRL